MRVGGNGWDSERAVMLDIERCCRSAETRDMAGGRWLGSANVPAPRAACACAGHSLHMLHASPDRSVDGMPLQVRRPEDILSAERNENRNNELTTLFPA